MDLDNPGEALLECSKDDRAGCSDNDTGTVACSRLPKAQAENGHRLRSPILFKSLGSGGYTTNIGIHLHVCIYIYICVCIYMYIYIY